LPERTPTPGEGRRPVYELPAEYEPTRPSAQHPGESDAPGLEGEVDPGFGGSLDSGPDDTTVRAVHRDAPPPETPPPPASDAGVAGAAEDEPRTRQEYLDQRDRERNGARTPRSARRVWLWRGVAIAVVLLMVPVAYSYVNHLRRPGTDSLGAKSVEWFRDHGGNGFVNTVERWWYTNNPPPTGGTPEAIKVPGTAGEVTAASGKPVTTAAPVQPDHLPPPTGRVPTPAAVVEANEGVWSPAGRLVGGLPAEYITFVRPDPAHTSYYTALMWLDTKLLRAQYVPGLNEPGGNGPNPWGSQIPVDQRALAIAAFNSGFKMDQARGGVYFDGTEVRGLVPGAASLIIRKDGSATVGVWGRDAAMSPDIASVRQNLELLVDNGGGGAGAPGGSATGQLNPELREDDTTAFGATLGNNVYVWRSGVGVTATGALVYAGGPAMSVVSLAKTLQNAGAVRAMELDINTDWVSAFTYVNENAADPNSPVVGIKLGGDMARDGNRYLVPGERDFFAFFADPQLPAATVPSTSTSTTRPK
jgi:hypothetical protein